MKKIPMLHNLKDKNDLINSYLIALIPLLVFGFYKNGILLYNNDLINFKSVFIPLYFYIVSIGIAIILSFFTKEKFKSNILIALILVATISINTNIFLYAVLIFILLFIVKFINTKKNFNINFNCLIRIFLILSLLIGNYSYLNIGEKLDKFNYSLWDIFIGFGTGGLASSSIFFIIISFIILCFNKYYKKIIAITSSISYFVLIAIFIFFTKNYDLTNYLLNGISYFSFVFLAADIKVSPYSSKGMIIYGLIIGIITSILTICLKEYYFEASFISIFMISFLIIFINKLTNKKYLHD